MNANDAGSNRATYRFSESRPAHARDALAISGLCAGEDVTGMAAANARDGPAY